ncbi:hypothetical protein C8A00DRAFT_14324 [Chaetomidium leptoderma]|uniref:CCHC-type domain-containing protein n=1 Tax=Chaetomidium leptoderma TaxID=669021 RepID=A0AAN6VQI0_9PEZI|nr:hypothetical protein C8A00DRAFT_14324 [Chaetomidium leptoderma]
MATAAPGQAAPEQEGVCYNCGVKGHWMVACPEPTRDMPAGLQRWHQHKEHGNPGRGGASRDKKGPVVTHYPPPPPAHAPPAIPYGQPTPPPFPPGLPPPPPLSSRGYSHPGYPPAPYPGSYQPPPPPPPQYGQYPTPPPPPPQYGQYPTPPPPPPHYGQQPPYGQPQYQAPYPPPAGYYPTSASPPPVPPPPSYPPGAYAPQQYGPPPPPPSSTPYPPPYATPAPPPPSSTPYPPLYPTPTPPLPGSYQYPPGQPQPYAPPPAAGSHYPPPPGWTPSQGGPPPPPPLSANQIPVGTHRGRQQKNHGSKRSHQRDKNRHGHEKPGKCRSRNERQGRRSSRDEQQLTTDDPKAKADEGPQEPAAEGTGKDDEWDPQFEEDWKQAFPEIKANPADPVGIPLASEYTEDPTIPPAYNATCVKSEFFQDGNQKEFGRSIKEHPSWATLQNDPVFKHYSGMVTRRFPDCEHEYPSYDPSDPPTSPSAIKIPPRFEIDRTALEETSKRGLADQDWRNTHNGYAQHHSPQGYRRREPGRDRYDRDEEDDRRPRKRSLDAGSENDRDHRDPKRTRWPQSRRDRSRESYTQKNHSRAISPRRRTPSPPKFNLDGDPWSPQAGESKLRPSSDRRYSDAHNDSKLSPSREERVSYSDKRHDSGYHSGQSLDKVTPRYRDDERERRPSDRSYRRRRSRSRSRSPQRSPSRVRSRGRSRTSTPDRSNRSRSRSRSESPLTRLEAELLGLTGESSESEPKPEPKPVPKKPIKRFKVAAAFK